MKILIMNLTKKNVFVNIKIEMMRWTVQLFY